MIKVKIKMLQINKSSKAAFLRVNDISKKQRAIKGKRKFLFFTFIKYRKTEVTAKNDIIAENDIQN